MPFLYNPHPPLPVSEFPFFNDPVKKYTYYPLSYYPGSQEVTKIQLYIPLLGVPSRIFLITCSVTHNFPRLLVIGCYDSSFGQSGSIMNPSSSVEAVTVCMHLCLHAHTWCTFMHILCAGFAHSVYQVIFHYSISWAYWTNPLCNRVATLIVLCSDYRGQWAAQFPLETNIP